MNTNRARLLAAQARELADVRRRHDPQDPVVGALEILASTIVDLAGQLDAAGADAQG